MKKHISLFFKVLQKSLTYTIRKDNIKCFNGLMV